MHLFPLNKKKLIVSIIIGAVAVIGDKNTEEQKNRLAAAICDNVTHGLIGAFTWIGIFVTKPYLFQFHFLVEIVLCALLSSFIDVDHFVAAKSVHLKVVAKNEDATSLKHRPLMHCTTFTVSIALCILVLSYLLRISWLYKLGWIFVAAFLSHHIRDSKRRGFWLWPFGSTGSTPNFLYIAAQMLLPHFLALVITTFSFSERFNTEVVNNVEVV